VPLFSEINVKPNFLRTTPAKKLAHRVLLPASCFHNGRDGRALCALKHPDHAGLLRIP
jgi:hypothetical protein